MQIHLEKWYTGATQVGDHLGMTIDMFRVTKENFGSISALAKQLLTRAATNKRWVPVKALVSLAKKTHFMYIAIPVARS